MGVHASPRVAAFGIASAALLFNAGFWIEPADARRGFGAVFSAGRVAGSAARSGGRAVRSTEETARIKQIESRINWGEAASKGLEVVKTAIETGSNLAGSAGGSSGSSASAFAGSVLGVLELEACVRESRWLDDRSDEFDAKKARLDAHQSEIERVGNEIDAARSRVNRSSQRSIDAFNARINEHRRLVNQYNTVMLPEVRDAQGLFNGRVRQFNSMCNGKRYSADDLAEVEQKIGFKLGN